MNVKTVAIIGAGISGLGAIKSCLEEGLIPTCFEMFDSIGGTWNLTKEHIEGQGAAVYASMRLNTSRHMSCYSDFPFPDYDDIDGEGSEKRNVDWIGDNTGANQSYTDCHGMRRYLQQYTDKFNLEQYIQFNCDVTKVRPTADYDETGRWLVTYNHHDTSTTHHDTSTTQQFDAVIVCSGRHRVPKLPTYPGLETFAGETMHAIKYRRPDVFKDKTILIIGNGNSAGDIAADAANVAKKVYFSSGRGFWIFPREITKGADPSDLFSRFMLNCVPLSLVNYMVAKELNKNIDHREYNLVPPDNMGPLSSWLILNETIAGKIKTGKVIVKHYIERVTENGVVFTDGSCIDGVDVIVFATGYNLGCNFLSGDIIPATWDKTSLYRGVLPTCLKHPTLHMVGCVAVYGSIFPAYETQARWAVAMLTNHLKPPSLELMLEEIEATKREFIGIFGYLKFWYLSFTYADKLAADLGLLPPFWRTLFTRPREFYEFYFWPAYPMALRLYGRHNWSGARQAIKDAHRKMVW